MTSQVLLPPHDAKLGYYQTIDKNESFYAYYPESDALRNEVCEKVDPSEEEAAISEDYSSADLRSESIEGWQFLKKWLRGYKRSGYEIPEMGTYNNFQIEEINARLNISMAIETLRSARKNRVASIEATLPKLVDEIIAYNPKFKNIDDEDLIQTLNEIINKLPYGILTTLKEEDIRKRVEKIMILESMVSAFKDITESQAELLDEITKE